MKTYTIKGHAIKLNKNEVKEVDNIAFYQRLDGNEAAQKAADIWMRCGATAAIVARRKAAVKALGLSDTIKFL